MCLGPVNVKCASMVSGKCCLIAVGMDSMSRKMSDRGKNRQSMLSAGVAVLDEDSTRSACGTGLGAKVLLGAGNSAVSVGI